MDVFYRFNWDMNDRKTHTATQCIQCDFILKAERASMFSAISVTYIIKEQVFLLKT